MHAHQVLAVLDANRRVAEPPGVVVRVAVSADEVSRLPARVAAVEAEVAELKAGLGTLGAEVASLNTTVSAGINELRTALAVLAVARPGGLAPSPAAAAAAAAPCPAQLLRQEQLQQRELVQLQREQLRLQRERQEAELLQQQLQQWAEKRQQRPSTAAAAAAVAAEPAVVEQEVDQDSYSSDGFETATERSITASLPPTPVTATGYRIAAAAAASATAATAAGSAAAGDGEDLLPGEDSYASDQFEDSAMTSPRQQVGVRAHLRVVASAVSNDGLVGCGWLALAGAEQSIEHADHDCSERRGEHHQRAHRRISSWRRRIDG